jgi:hypothetical protein
MTYSVVLSGSVSLLYRCTLGLPIFRESNAMGSSDGCKTTFTAVASNLVQDDSEVDGGGIVVVVIHASTIDAIPKDRANRAATRRPGIVFGGEWKDN